MTQIWCWPGFSWVYFVFFVEGIHGDHVSRVHGDLCSSLLGDVKHGLFSSLFGRFWNDDPKWTNIPKDGLKEPASCHRHQETMLAACGFPRSFKFSWQLELDAVWRYLKSEELKKTLALDDGILPCHFSMVFICCWYSLQAIGFFLQSLYVSISHSTTQWW